MHRIFNIEEVVREIVAYIVDRPTLSALARTARFLEQPAYTGLLFKVNDEFLRFLTRTLLRPSDDRQRNAGSRSRCLFLAQFVREFEIHGPLARGESWSEVQTALTVIRRPICPFPQLRAIDIDSTPALAVIDIMDVLLCPAVERLGLELVMMGRVVVPAFEGRLLAFLDGLPDKACRLSYLTVTLPYSDEHDWPVEFQYNLANVIGEACRRLPLVSIETENIPITSNLLRDLASITTLRSAKLAFDPFVEALQFPEVCRASGGFRSLTRAHFRCGRLIGEILKYLNEAKLCELSMDLLEWGPHVAVVLETVDLFADTLEILEVCEANSDEFPWLEPSDSDDFPWLELSDEFQVSRRSFMSVSRCSRIKQFRFTFPRAPFPVVELTKGDLEHLAKAWEMLEILDFKYWCETEGAVIPLTIESFVPFSLHCPCLREITIQPLSPTLNVRVPPSPLQPHPWKVLSIGYPMNFYNLPTWHAAKITHYLDALWGDVFLQMSLPWSYNFRRTGTTSMNGILDGIRTSRAMRPGSRWRLQHPVEPYLSDAVFTSQSFENFADACPWEIIG